MPFFVRCSHSLKKCQLDTKRVANKQKSLQIQDIIHCTAHQSHFKNRNLKKKLKKSINSNYILGFEYCFLRPAKVPEFQIIFLATCSYLRRTQRILTNSRHIGTNPDICLKCGLKKYFINKVKTTKKTIFIVLSCTTVKQILILHKQNVALCSRGYFFLI